MERRGGGGAGAPGSRLTCAQAAIATLLSMTMPRWAHPAPLSVRHCVHLCRCKTCTQRGICGWCKSSKRCMQGDEDGVNPKRGTCNFPDTFWAFVTTDC
jgi:hypothetical protein